MAAYSAPPARRGRGRLVAAAAAAGALLLSTHEASFVLGASAATGRSPAVLMRGAAADSVQRLEEQRVAVAAKIADANQELFAAERKLKELRAEHQALAMQKLPAAKAEALKELGAELLSMAQSGASEADIVAKATSMESGDVYASKALQGTWTRVYGDEMGDDLAQQTLEGGMLSAMTAKGGFEGDVTLKATYKRVGKKTLEVDYQQATTAGLFGMVGGSNKDLSADDTQESVRMLLFGDDKIRVEYVTHTWGPGKRLLYVYAKTA